MEVKGRSIIRLPRIMSFMLLPAILAAVPQHPILSLLAAEAETALPNGVPAGI